MRINALRCIRLRLGAFRCTRACRLESAIHAHHAGPGLRNLRDWAPAPKWRMVWSMDEILCRPLVSCPKFDCSLPTTAAAAPTAFDLVYLQVVWGEQMAIAANAGYRHGLADAFHGKAHHLSFGCFKARPRYQLYMLECSRGSCTAPASY